MSMVGSGGGGNGGAGIVCTIIPDDETLSVDWRTPTTDRVPTNETDTTRIIAMFINLCFMDKTLQDPSVSQAMMICRLYNCFMYG